MGTRDCKPLFRDVLVTDISIFVQIEGRFGLFTCFAIDLSHSGHVSACSGEVSPVIRFS